MVFTKGSFARENEMPADVIIGVKQRSARPACTNEISVTFTEIW